MRFDREIQAPGVQFKKAKRKTPDHMGNLLIMLAGSIVATVGVIVCVAMFCWEGHPAFQTAGIVGIVFICAVMFAVLTNPAYWQTVETIEGHDLAEQPAPYQALPEGDWRIILENESDSHQAWLNFDTPELRRKAKLAAQLTVNGTPFSENSMCGKSRPLSRSEFMTLRDLYLFHGLLVWKDKEVRTLGTQWTAAGRSYVRKLASESTTHARMSTQGSQEILPAYTDGQGDSHD